MQRIKVISVGLGPIGLSIANLALSRTKEIEIVGAVDIDPKLKGRDLGEIAGTGKAGIEVSDSVAETKDADVALHATTSFLDSAKPQLIELCKKDLDVISTNEELSYPWYNHKQTAIELDKCAKDNGVTILGTGVNPGFVLDALAITLSGACANVSEVRAERILDATKRRLPFQKKVGIGLSVNEFEENVRKGKFGHIGLPESMAMVCDALGKPIEKFEQKIRPKVSAEPIRTEHFGLVEKGKVLGLVQDAQAYAGTRRIASYHLEMYAGASDPHDEIEIVGEPNLKMRILGGTPGDIATSAVIVNSIPRVVESSPGLVTLKDIRPASSVFR
jgi:hypothetical protein